MSARDELARVLYESGYSYMQGGNPTWETAGELRRTAYRQADAVLSKWLPTIIPHVARYSNLRRGCFGKGPALVTVSMDELLTAFSTLSLTSPAPVPSPTADEHDDRPGDSAPVAPGPVFVTDLSSTKQQGRTTP